MDAAELTFWIDDEVFIRPVGVNDVDGVLKVVQTNYDHLRTFMEWAKADYGLSDAREWVLTSVTGASDGNQLNFVIVRGETIIGTIGFALFDLDAMVTEIGYWIDRGEEGKGFITRACAYLLGLAFDEFGMNRVQIRCASGNTRSAAIPERFGFTKEGVQRQHMMRDGKIYDFLVYGLLKDEWDRKKAA